MFDKNMILKILALLCIVLVVGTGIIVNQAGGLKSLENINSNADSGAMPAYETKSSVYYPDYPYYHYDEHSMEKYMLLGGLTSVIFCGSGLLLWNTIGPGKIKDPKLIDKNIDFSRMLVHALVAGLGFSIISGAIVGLTMSWYSDLLSSDFMKLFLVLGFAFPIGLFLYLQSKFSAKESALASMLEFGFSLVLFPVCMLLFLLIAYLLSPPPYYVM